MNMKLRAIALIALMSVLTFAANAQATRADLPAPDNFLGIATFPLWDGDVPRALKITKGRSRNGKEIDADDVPGVVAEESLPSLG